LTTHAEKRFPKLGFGISGEFDGSDCDGGKGKRRANRIVVKRDFFQGVRLLSAFGPYPISNFNRRGRVDTFLGNTASAELAARTLISGGFCNQGQRRQIRWGRWKPQIYVAGRKIR